MSNATAALLGSFLGAALAVTILTWLIGVIIRRPLLPVVIATVSAILLSIGGNDGVNPNSLAVYLVAGVLLGAWRAIRHQHSGTTPEHLSAVSVPPAPATSPQAGSPSPKVRASSLAPAQAASLRQKRVTSPQPQQKILLKLYLTIFWGLALLCGAVALGVFVVNVHDHLTVSADIACWNKTMSYERCGLREMSWGETRSIYSSRTWHEGSISRDAQSTRFVLALTSPLWLTPLVLLVLVRRWLLWLLRPEPAASSDQG
jgi:hypothetical protein